MAWECREGIRKAKAQLELNLARDVKNNKKGFFGYLRQHRKMKETVSPMSKTGDLATTGMEKAEVLNKFLPWSSPQSALATPPNSQNPKAVTGRMKYHLP